MQWHGFKPPCNFFHFLKLNIHEFKHNNNVKINVFITKKIIPKVFNEKIRTNRNLSIYIGL